jgi:hypothetical protein
MSEWVVQEDWSEVQVDDHVRVTRVGGMLTGKVVDRYFLPDEDEPHAVALLVDGLQMSVHITNLVWSLFVPAKPAVEIPTKVGTVISWQETHWLALANLEDTNQWLHQDANFTTEEMVEQIGDAEFVILEPVAVTAKKVIDFCESDKSCNTYRSARHEFGVIK